MHLLINDDYMLAYRSTLTISISFFQRSTARLRLLENLLPQRINNNAEIKSTVLIAR